jgi:alginate O-acetyltransferase complex protein AlgJ
MIHRLQSFNKYIEWMVVSFFFITICTPLIGGLVTNIKQISVTEKRKLAQRPAFPDSMESLTLFPQAFENYFKDQFGLRNEMMKLYNRIKFKIGDSASKKVAMGKDGWLFLNGETGSIPFNKFRNVNLFTEIELRQFARLLTKKYEWLKKRDIQYLFIVAPDKHTIYEEMLPSYITKANKDSALTQLIQYLQKNTDVPFVDLRPILMANKSNPFAPLYYKYDTHWNYYGANFAQYEIAKKIDELIPNKIVPYLYKPDEFKIMPTDGVDLATLIGLRDETMANHSVSILKQKLCGQVIISEFTSKPQSIICRKSTLNGIIFRDSFFDKLQSYFTRYFKLATYIRNQASISDFEHLIKEEKPDIVIEEIVERTLPIKINASAIYEAVFLRQIFDANDQITYDLNLADLNKMEIGKNLEVLATPHPLEGNILQMNSTGPDPTMEVSDIHFDPDSDYILKIKIHSGQADKFQLFFSKDTSKGYPFSEKNSIIQSLTKGVNEFFIILDAKHLGSQLRIDPGNGAGEFKIDEFKIKKLKLP